MEDDCMDHNIVKIDAGNYSLFDDMIYWRMNDSERLPSKEAIPQSILNELCNPDLLIYAIEADGRYVGWISLIYMPKVGKYNGYGHVYVDELWIQPSYRKNGFAYELLKKAEELKKEKCAAGIRLYVDIDNISAKKLYEKCDFNISGSAYLMEK
jgi:ribosomal protein S18 acetylase RimI-like enzyme